MADIRVVVGQNTRRLRRAAGLSQEQLAEQAGITQQHLSGLERGTQNPTVLTLAQIAEALGASVVALVGPVPPE